MFSTIEGLVNWWIFVFICGFGLGYLFFLISRVYYFRFCAFKVYGIEFVRVLIF